MFEENIKLKQRENETDITSHNGNSSAHAENKTKITESGLLSHAFLSVVDGTETRSQVQSADIHPNRFPSVWFSQHSRGQSSPFLQSNEAAQLKLKLNRVASQPQADFSNLSLPFPYTAQESRSKNSCLASHRSKSKERSKSESATSILLFKSTSPNLEFVRSSAKVF